MNVFTLLTNWRSSRLDLHLSRLSLASLICLCMLCLGVGQMWGTDLYGNYAGSAVPSGWTQAGSFSSNNYYQLGTTGDYFQSPLFSTKAVGTITVVVKAYVTGTSKSSTCSLIGLSAGGTAVETKSVTCNSTSMTSSYPNTTWTLSNTNDEIKQIKFSYKKPTGSNMRIKSVTITYTEREGDVFELVTDLSELDEDDEIIILNTGGTKALGATQNTNNRAPSTGFTLSGTTVTEIDNTVQVMGLSASSTNWQFYVGSGYLYAASSSYNYLKTQTPNDNNGKWRLSLNASYEATITAQGTNSHNLLQYTSDVFSCYTGAQTAVKIYKRIPPQYTVTWVAGSNDSFHTQTDVAGTALESPGTPDAGTYCSGGKVFVGWSDTEIDGEDDDQPADLFTSIAGKSIPEGGTTYYAVFATESEGGGSSSATIAPEDLDVSSSDAINGAKVGTITFGGAQGGNGTVTNVPKYYSGTPNTIRCYASNDFTISSTNTITQIDFTYDGSYTGGTISLSTGSWTATPTTNWNQTWTGSATSITFRIGSTAWRITGIKVTTSGGTTYSDYATTCCTQLGYINGSVSWSNGTSATLTWDKMSNVAASTPYTITCKQTGGSSAGSVGSVDLTGSKATCTITGLTAGNSYDFKIAVSAASSYCDKDSTMTSIAPKITVKSAPVALIGSDYAEGVSGGGTVKTFTVSGVGLTGALTFTAPTNFQVSTDNGSTWSTSGGSKTLAASGTLAETTIKARLVEGLSVGTYGGATTYITISGGGAAAVNSSVSIAGTVSAACSVPSIGNPTLTSITSSTITVSCPTISGGTNCDVDDYGFIWKAGSAPTMASYDGKKQTGTNNQSSSYSDGLSITVTTGTTYHIKAYAHNSAGNNVSSTALQVTPQKVTFNSNGGSDVDAKYVNYNTPVSAPGSSPTKAGYDFDSWRTTSGLTTEMNFSGAIVKDTTLYAKWNPASYDVTLKANGGTSSDQVVSATYTQAMPGTVKAGTDIVAPTYNGYTFGGYYDNADYSLGTQYYTNTLASAHVWDKTSAANLYGRWTANQYTVTLDANGGTLGATTSVNTTFGEDMPTIASANLPTREGYRFLGFWAGKTTGDKYYNDDGTSAKKQARYSANQTLYARWQALTYFSVNGDIVLTIDDGDEMPGSGDVDVPTECGNCWAFLGWSTDENESVAIDYAGGATNTFGTPDTLFAVFGQVEYKMINSTSGLVANDNYVVTFYYNSNDHEYALSNTKTYTHDAAVTDVTSLVRENGEGWFIYNVGANNIWKFTGTYSSGQLYNAASGKYVNLSSTSSDLLNTTNNLTFTNDGIFWTVKSTNYLKPYTNTSFEISSSKPSYSCFLYHQVSSTVSTTPSCETYDIVWKVAGTPLASGSQTEETTTCTGVETMPDDPDNDELDCANVFMGWSESELVGTGHDEPDDLFLTVGYAPKIDEDKTFHAVFATAAPITNKYVLGTVDDLKDGQKVILVNHTSSVACTSTAGSTTGTLTKVDISSSFSNDTLVTSESSIVWTVTKSSDYYVFKQGDNYLRATGDSYLYCDGTSDKWTITDGSVDGTYYLKSYNGSDTKFEYYSSKTYFTTYNGTGAQYNTDFYIPAISYSDYQTICCDNSVTIGEPSITGSGTVTFAVGGNDLDPGDEVETCTSAKDVVATVTPAAGYSCTAVSFGSVSVSPTPGEGNYPSAPSSQNYTLSFAKETTSATLSTSATFTAKPLTAWAWKYKKDADAADGSVDPYDIPDVVEIYIDQYARFIIDGYTPSDVISDKQGYVYSAGGVEPAYSTSYLTRVANTPTYFTLKGKAATESTTIVFKATGDNTITKTMTIRVKALPSVTFVDKLQDKTDFTNWGTDGVVSSTVTTGVVTHTKPTPSHADISDPGASYNACERSHLHLVGWIESTWADAHPSATHEQIVGANVSNGAGTFLEAGADFNVETYNGNIYYAVWSQVE